MDPLDQPFCSPILPHQLLSPTFIHLPVNCPITSGVHCATGSFSSRRVPLTNQRAPWGNISHTDGSSRLFLNNHSTTDLCLCEGVCCIGLQHWQSQPRVRAGHSKLLSCFETGGGYAALCSLRRINGGFIMTVIVINKQHSWPLLMTLTAL